MFSYRLLKSRIVLYRRTDPLVDRLQGIQNGWSFNFFNAICSVLKDRNDGLSGCAAP
jgi:hypothetical protein